MVGLAGEYRHHERDQPADHRQPKRRGERRSDRPGNVPALQHVGERQQRRGDDRHDQHTQHQTDQRLKVERSDDETEGEQDCLVDDSWGDPGLRHVAQGCP
jgi:hypothetical protein